MKSQLFLKRIFFLLVIWLSGCATSQGIPQSQSNFVLQQAEQTIQAAAEDEDVQRYSRQRLAEAEAYLQAAKTATDLATMRHQVYLAEQTAQLAITEAEEAALKQVNERLKDQKGDWQQRQAQQIQAEKDRAAAAQRARKAQLQAVQARQTNQGILVTLNEASFLPQQMTLAPDSELQLKKISQLFRQYPRHRGIIKAVVNSNGSADYVQGISQRLADTVLYALVEQGVPSNRLQAQGVGTAQRNNTLQRQVSILLTPN